MKHNQRRPRVFRGNFDVLPTNAAAPTGLQSLQRRFFCREARGIMLRGDRATRFTVGAFGISEDAFGKARSARDGFPHAADFDKVDSD